MQADGQGLTILAHHFQARESQVVQVPPGGSEIQLKACNRKESGVKEEPNMRGEEEWSLAPALGQLGNPDTKPRPFPQGAWGWDAADSSQNVCRVNGPVLFKPVQSWVLSLPLNHVTPLDV